ncbi:MAG: hypothetical protein UT39_C0021G0025 [Candidatus Woesebacteria bacterium GW2011_GWA1_39_21]|uniref:Uncharacterized protein n=1 Tax=Candidatus Woesebacteria bacterium GW2011_GWA1_39_21 TaxID=1618550 RepID=A0A0G0N4F3_9BACT|nr:MAG: hypothetical protein UT39_C0021G0025 [Candidatus Woesebacteria bacterium GW2011_GWA1_39_21]
MAERLYRAGVQIDSMFKGYVLPVSGTCMLESDAQERADKEAAVYRSQGISDAKGVKILDEHPPKWKNG